VFCLERIVFTTLEIGEAEIYEIEYEAGSKGSQIESKDTRL